MFNIFKKCKIFQKPCISLRIGSDGSASHNHDVGGYAFYCMETSEYKPFVRFNTYNIEFHSGAVKSKAGVSNDIEIKALCKALKYARKKYKKYNIDMIHIELDSFYVLRLLVEINKKSETYGDKAFKNSSLNWDNDYHYKNFKILSSYLKNKNFTLCHSKAHCKRCENGSVNQLNAMCDAMAKEALRKSLK